MGILVSNKVISPATIRCNELATVTLTLTAAPDLLTNPADIMLVLDHSGSMGGTPLTALKAAAINFVHIIRDATNPGGTDLGGASRIGIVSFASNATLDVPLTQNVTILNNAINALTAGGSTNTAAAFSLAASSYTPPLTPPNKKVLVIITDGDPTVPLPNPDTAASTAAAAARAAGIEIYAIGLGDNIDVNNLNDWATDPDNTHVLVAPTPAELQQAFEDLAANINTPGAIGVTVVDTVANEFEIVGIPVLNNPPTTTANASIDGTDKKITWTLDKLGLTATESATLTFKVKYLGTTNATLPLNASITYTDQHIPPNQVAFTPNIIDIDINCENVVIPDCCEAVSNILFDECTTVVDIDLPVQGDAYNLKCDGRLLVLGVRLKNICPGRRIALGIIATEIIGGIEYERGYKAITVPRQAPPVDGSPCTEFIVRPITFVFPEDLDNTSDACDIRDFRIRVIAHYIDIGLPTYDFCPIIPVPTVK